jgi:alanyl-tRNA synthetase
MRRHDQALSAAAETLRVTPERVPDSVSELRGRVRELEKRGSAAAGGNGAIDVDELLSRAAEVDGARVLVAALQQLDGKALLDLADRLKTRLGEAAIVLGSAGEERVDLVATVAPGLVERGVRAGEIVKAAAAAVGGGGGGRDTLARAGGRDVAKLPEALAAAQLAIEAALNR